MNTTNDLFLTTQEFADLLKTPRVNVYRWVHKGWIQGIRIGPRAIRIPASEVDRILRNRVVADEDGSR